MTEEVGSRSVPNLKLSRQFQCSLHLGVFSCEQLFRGLLDRNARRYTFALDQPTLPREVCRHGKPHNVSESGLERAATQEPSGSLSSDNRCEVVLLGKSGYHFSGTGCVFVDQNYHASVETLGT